MNVAVNHIVDRALLAAWRRLQGLRCKRSEHQWAATPPVILRGAKFGPYRVCTRCDGPTRLVLLDEPPFEHPDSMTVELPREQEEWLAELADRTWPPAPGDDDRDAAEAWAHLTFGEDQ